MQNPVWVTIIAAVGGALIGLVASIGTTFLANKHAVKRQKADLMHSAKMEREKLLFAARMELYARVPELVANVHQYFASVLEELSHGMPIESLHPHRENMRITEEARALHQGTTIVSSKTVMDSAEEFSHLVLQANGVLHKMRESGESYIPREFPLPELATGAADLHEQIRIELGVAAAEGLRR